jgi:hypothetical protein
LLDEYFPEKSDPHLSFDRRRPSTADLEAHSWINERPVVALSGSSTLPYECPLLEAKADIGIP